MSKVFYGLSELEWLDVTAVAAASCMVGTTLVITVGDPERAAIFSDPYVGQLKKVFIESAAGDVVVYDHQTEVDIPDFV